MATTGKGRFTRTLIALELLLCVAAIGGGVQLAAVAPHDAMPADVLARTPFSSWVWPGVLLIATVAVPAALVAAGAIAGRAWSHIGHVAVGLILVGWIGAQVLVIGPVSVLQPVMAGWGLAITVLGAAHYRHWHLGWGATPAERAEPLPGDEWIVRPHFAATRAVSIGAPPAEVWERIAKMGYGRAGWYSYDLLDNRPAHGADRVLPVPDLDVGDIVPMSRRIDEHTAFEVLVAVPDRLMVWGKPDASWTWRLSPAGDSGTRLVTRVRTRYAGRSAPLSAALMELADFPMMRRCLLGLKERAESAPVAPLTLRERP